MRHTTHAYMVSIRFDALLDLFCHRPRSAVSPWDSQSPLDTYSWYANSCTAESFAARGDAIVACVQVWAADDCLVNPFNLVSRDLRRVHTRMPWVRAKEGTRALGGCARQHPDSWSGLE